MPSKETIVFQSYDNNCKVRPAWVLPTMAAFLVLAALMLCCACSAPAKNSVDSYSWSELSKIAKEIHDAPNDEEGLAIAQGYHLTNSSGKLDGSQTKKVTLSDGTTTHVMLAGIRHDDLASGGKAGLTFLFTDAPVAHAMNADPSNEGGWEKSQMRAWLNDEFAGMLPSDLKGALNAASKKTDNLAYTTPGAVSSTSDKVWLPSLVEVAGSISASSLPAQAKLPAGTYSAEGKQYQVFSGVSVGEENGKLTRKYTGKDGSGIVVAGEPCPWWLRSFSMTWTSGFAAVDEEGDPLNAWFTDYELGVAPGFCL